MRVSLSVPSWTNLRLIKVILVASTLTYLPSLKVASSKNSVACIKRSAPSQVHIIWYQSFGSWYRFYPILSYPIFFLCNLSRFVFLSLFCYLRSCSCFLCLSHFVSKKKLQKFWKKSGCLIFEHKIKAVRFFSEFWAFWYIVGLKRTTIAKVMSIWSLLVISVILCVILSNILFVIISVTQIKGNLLSKSNLIYYPNQI